MPSKRRPDTAGGLLDEALADLGHPKHADQKEWIRRPFDPHVFDIDEINARLQARE